MRLFGSERIAGIMQRFGGFEEGQAIEHKMITNSVERAQKKVEENNYAIRKRLLEYDNVMNEQRKIVYERRRQALMGERLKDDLFEMVESNIEEMVAKFLPESDLDGLKDEVQRTFLVRLDLTPEKFIKLGEAGTKELILSEARAFYKRKEERYGNDLMGQIERFAMLSIIDEKWKEHLREMDDLKEGINFRAYGQKDPLIEYKMDGFKIFQVMLDSISVDVINFIFKFTTQTPEEAKSLEVQRKTGTQRMQTVKASSEGMGYIGNLQPEENEAARTGKKQPVKVTPKVGRNDPCPCGSGKKYKNCHGKSL
jgi:preprotein translocase subunit SecA